MISYAAGHIERLQGPFEWQPAAGWSEALQQLGESDLQGVAVIARDDIQLDNFAGDEIRRAVEDASVASLSWLMLVSDGVAIDGRTLDNGAFLDHPPNGAYYTAPALGAADPAWAVVDLDRLRRLEPRDVGGTIAAGWRSGFASYISPFLRYSVAMNMTEHRRDRPFPAWKSVAMEEQLAWLRSARPDPTLTISIRTTLSRDQLLDRALAAIAAAAGRLPPASVMITGTVPLDRLTAQVERLGDAHPGLALSAVSVIDTDLPSRTASMLAALDRAATDYVWFVDDDDWVTESSLETISAAVRNAGHPVIIGPSVVVREEDGSATPQRTYDPTEWHRAFTGWNPLPNCSIVVPRCAALERVAAAPVRNDLGEDYALLLLVLGSPRQTVVTVTEPLANVSIRPGTDNSITEADPATWLRERSSFMADIVSDEDSSSQALWALGEVVQRNIPFEARLDAADMERKWWQRRVGR